MATYCLGANVIVTNRLIGRSAPIPLLRLLQLGLGQLLGELMLQLEEIKQIKLDLNNSKYNKLKVLETKVISTYVCGLRSSIKPLVLVLLPVVGLPE